MGILLSDEVRDNRCAVSRDSHRTGVVLPLVVGQGHGVDWGRWKQVATAALAARFGSVERTPPKHQEMRIAGITVPPWLPASDLVASLEAIPGVKFARHLRRNAKLRLFRIWKLFNDSLKSGETESGATELGYRQLGERLRTLGFVRRL
jgi:hypothetical protein